MTTQTESALAKLTALSQTLDSVSNQLSQQITEIESALNDLHFGVWAWLRDDPLDVEEVSEVGTNGQRSSVHHIQQLGYGKHKGKWGFLVASGTQESWGADVTITFLQDAPREIKLRAIERIHKLLDILAEGLNRVTQKTTEKVMEAREIATALRKS